MIQTEFVLRSTDYGYRTLLGYSMRVRKKGEQMRDYIEIEHDTPPEEIAAKLRALADKVEMSAKLLRSMGIMA